LTDFAELVATIDSSGVRRGGDELKRFTKTAEDTERKTKGATDRMAANYNRAGSNISATLGRLTGRLVALGAAAVSIGQAGRTLAQFDGAMSKVAAITGATGAELDNMRGLAQQLGSTTEFSATQAADALTFLGMAGFEASESMTALPAVLDLATASGMDLAQTADIASNVLSGFGMAASESADVADVLAAAATSANTNVSQLGQAMSTAAPIAASLGIGLEEAAAAIGVMSDAGIQGERAGTALRGVLAGLANPTKAARDALAEYGLTAAEVNPETEGLVTVMARMRDAGISTADAMTIFGREAASGALVLVKGADRFRDFTGELREADGAAGDMAATMRDNLGGDMKGLMSSVEGLILALGDAGLTAVLRGVVQGVTGFVRGITAIVSAISDGVGAVSEFTRQLFGIQSAEQIHETAIDNVTIALGDQMRATEALHRLIASGIPMTLDMVEAELAKARARRQGIDQLVRERQELELQSLGYFDLLKSIADHRKALDALRAPGDDIDQMPLRLRDSYTELEAKIASLLQQRQEMLDKVRSSNHLREDEADTLAQIKENIANLRARQSELNGETKTSVVLTERLGMAAQKISFENATASAITLSRQLGVSLAIAQQLDQAGFDYGDISPERLSFAVPTTGSSPSFGFNPSFATTLGEGPLTFSGETITQYEAMRARARDVLAAVDSMGASVSGAASRQQELNDVARVTQQILGEVNKEAVTYADVVTQLSQLLNEGAISQEQFNAAVDLADERLNNVDDAGRATGERLGNMFSSAIRNAESLSEALTNIADQLLDMALDSALKDLFAGLFGGSSGGSIGGSSGGFLSSIFSGLHDSGGFISSGKVGIVGERGPEIVRGPAHVVSRADTARAMNGGPGITVQVINNHPTGRVSTRTQKGPDGREVLIAEVNDAAAAGRLTGFDSRYGLGTRARAR